MNDADSVRQAMAVYLTRTSDFERSVLHMLNDEDKYATVSLTSDVYARGSELIQEGMDVEEAIDMMRSAFVAAGIGDEMTEQIDKLTRLYRQLAGRSA